MARIIEEVAIKIGADTRGLNKGLKQSKKQVGGLTSMFKKLGIAMVGVFGARAMFRGFKRTLDAADQLIKTAKGVGFTVNEYQRLTFALDQVGVSAGSAKIAIGDFQKRLSKAVAGTSPQFQKAFEQAGLDTASLSKMSPAAAFSAAMTHLATLRDDPRIAGLTGNVFEEQSGKDVLQVLRQWEKFLGAREKFASRVGSLNEKQVDDLQKMREETKLYGQQWEMLKMQIVADAAPSLLTAFKSLEEAGTFEKMGKGLTALIDGIASLTTNLTKFTEAWQKGSDAFSLTPAFGVTAYRTPKGQATPDERAEHFAHMARLNSAPGLAKTHSAAERAAGMSLDINVTGDTSNARNLARLVAVEVQRLREAEKRAGGF